MINVHLSAIYENWKTCMIINKNSKKYKKIGIFKNEYFSKVGEGDVWIRCHSDHSVFVQSYYLDR